MEWTDLYSKHKGETGLVIGNGSSLKDVPIEFLKKYPSFGTNKIYMLDGFTPSYYVSVNELVIQQSAEQINKMQCVKFVKGGIVEIHDFMEIISAGHEMFQYNPPYFYEGHTVTFVCLQLAYYMGFETVLMVGVDHSYKVNGVPNEKQVWQGDDPNHFHPDYFKGHEWHNPDLARSERAYYMALDAYSKAGRRIVNLTKDTRLDVFEKQEITLWS